MYQKDLRKWQPMNIFKFNLGDKVKITCLENMKGRVISIWVEDSGTKYQVRYFWECTAKEVYFYEDELELVK